MTHRHRFRRGVAPRPSDKDLRLLGRLLKRAERACRPDGAGAVPFVVAAEKAAKAVLPVGHQGRESVFVRLIQLGQGFGRMSAEGRAGQAADVERLVAACRAVLTAGPQGQGCLPFRKDVDG
jgi:hypothetical protein